MLCKFKKKKKYNFEIKICDFIILTGPEGGGDARSHHRSKQHVEGQDILRVVGHVLQLVLGGAGVQGQLPGTVPAHEL